MRMRHVLSVRCLPFHHTDKMDKPYELHAVRGFPVPLLIQEPLAGFEPAISSYQEDVLPIEL